MKYLLLLCTLLIGLTSTITAQVTISGFVRSRDSLPVVAADVLIHRITPGNNPLVKFTRTSDRGFYSLTFDETHSTYSITVRSTNFQTIKKELEISPGLTSISLNFLLNPSVSFLDTVKVDLKISISKTGDTITFNPDAFMLKNEVHIEDMIKRLPGVEVKENGDIYFNGRRIVNVLIDGDDLFKDDYKVLTQNAASKIVDRVQVIKNYKKDELFKQFDRPGDQVMNLTIKEQYKNYLFGNATAGYGNRDNKVGDLFLMKLGTNLKTQAGVNYNTTGSKYHNESRFYLQNISRNSYPFFKYAPAKPLLSISRYDHPHIPDHYQNRNESIRAHFNTLLKKNKWETLVNANLSGDESKENQELRSIYSDGTVLFKKDLGSRKDYRQGYSVTSTKNTKTESIYLNATLENTHRAYHLNTHSNEALESRQQLKGNDANWQLNLNYNRKLGENLLWSNTMGYFAQNAGENLRTKPDFLFWLYPQDLSLYNLLSNSNTQVRYFNIQSSLLAKRGKLSHEFAGLFTLEKRTVISAIHADEGVETKSFFENNDSLTFPGFSLKYTGSYQISPKTKISLKLSSDPQILHFKNTSLKYRRSAFYYDYSLGISKKNRHSTMGVSAGTRKQVQDRNLFFSNSIQSDFHRLTAGRMDTFGAKTTYAQATYSLFSVKLGWIAFASVHFNHNENKYIRNIETKGIATIHSQIYYPTNTNQILMLINTQKTLGKWPFSLNSNIVYNIQGDYNRLNGTINSSTLSFLNSSIGVKSLFESTINFDYHFSWLNSLNKTSYSEVSTKGTNTILNKVTLHVTPKKVLNTTIVFNQMATNSGRFKGNFFDVKFNKRLWKERCMVEFHLRNILDKKHISNTVIGSYFTRESRTEIRGREFFLTVRYELR